MLCSRTRPIDWEGGGVQQLTSPSSVRCINLGHHVIPEMFVENDHVVSLRISHSTGKISKTHLAQSRRD